MMQGTEMISSKYFHLRSAYAIPASAMLPIAQKYCGNMPANTRHSGPTSSKPAIKSCQVKIKIGSVSVGPSTITV